jgi:hypothetical protein
MLASMISLRTLARAGMVVAALVATSVVPLSASAQVPTPTYLSLAVAVEPVELTAATALNRLPGRTKPGEITLTRGLTA